MSRKEYSAGVVIFQSLESNSEQSQRRYLLLNNGQFWDFPKGHVEAGESDVDAAIRELREETGINNARMISGFCHQIRYYFRQGTHLVEKTVVFFLAWTSCDDIKLSGEHMEFAWLTCKEAIARLAYPNSREILRLADRFGRSDATNASI